MPVYDGGRYYHSIPGLLVPKTITSDDVHDAINTFIDTIPGLTERLENTLLNQGAGTLDFFAETMESVIEMLKNMYARGLETQAVRLLRCTKEEAMLATAKKNLKPFVTDALSLSVAMQKAQAIQEDKKAAAPSKIEIYANIAKSISAVNSLLEDGFYEPAKILLKELAEHNPDASVFISLQNLINAERYEDAKRQIYTLNEKFKDTMSKLAGTDLSKKILAVDDMPEILTFVNNALKNNYRVLAAPGGKVALKMMETQKPDLFILDIDMPDMDGFELAVRIRQMPEHETTPIIFLTGNSSREYITNAKICGGNEFIIKPATHDYLLTKVGSFLYTKE
ncbi:MAG: response regulator [Defluviitaleaceae bacterium]|nr:response regulator [Defluviitaleaceae bacterium]